MTEEPAENIKGFLLYMPDLDLHIFRVYKSADKRTFVDYDLRINDLEIQILGNYSSLYSGDDKTAPYIGYPSRLFKRKSNVLQSAEKDPEDSNGTNR